jgi:uncharacterized membrane protein
MPESSVYISPHIVFLPFTLFFPYFQTRYSVNKRERRERNKVGRVVLRDTTMVGVEETIFAALNIPRQCPLVLFLGVKLVFGVNYILILMKLEGLL